LLTSYYGMMPTDIDDLTMTQVSGYIEQVQMLEYRRHWPTAVMIAQMGNFQGGRSKKKSKVSDSTPYRPEDFMPYLWHANYKPYMELTAGEKSGIDAVDADALRELYDRRSEISGMFYNSVDWNGLRERLGIVEE